MSSQVTKDYMIPLDKRYKFVKENALPTLPNKEDEYKINPAYDSFNINMKYCHINEDAPFVGVGFTDDNTACTRPSPSNKNGHPASACEGRCYHPAAQQGREVIDNDTYNYYSSNVTPEIRNFKPLFQAAHQCKPVEREGVWKCSWDNESPPKHFNKNYKLSDQRYEQDLNLIDTQSKGKRVYRDEQEGEWREREKKGFVQYRVVVDKNNNVVPMFNDRQEQIRVYKNPQIIYKKIAFPSEYKYLLDWNNAQWSASLAVKWDRDVETTLKHLEQIDNDISQHIYATPMWDEVWEEGLTSGTAFTINRPKEGYPYAAPVPCNGDGLVECSLDPKQQALLPTDPRILWRKKFRERQNETLSTSKILLQYVTPNYFSKESFQNKSYKGDDAWADNNPAGYTDFHPYAEGNPISEDKFTSIGHMYPADLQNGPNNSWFSEMSGHPGRYRDIYTGVRIKEKQTSNTNTQPPPDDNFTLEYCRKHIFDKYRNESDGIFKLKTFGISKEVWTKMILKEVFSKRQEKMAATAYDNLRDKIKESSYYKTCELSTWDKFTDALSMALKIAKIVSAFMSIVGGVGWILDKVSGDAAAALEADYASGAIEKPEDNVTESSLLFSSQVKRTKSTLDKGLKGLSTVRSQAQKMIKEKRSLKIDPSFSQAEIEKQYGMTEKEMIDIGSRLSELEDSFEGKVEESKNIWKTEDRLIKYYNDYWMPTLWTPTIPTDDEDEKAAFNEELRKVKEQIEKDSKQALRDAKWNKDNWFEYNIFRNTSEQDYIQRLARQDAASKWIAGAGLAAGAAVASVAAAPVAIGVGAAGVGVGALMKLEQQMRDEGM
jgi:hypothetical protein